MLQQSLYFKLTILLFLFFETAKGLPNLNETSQEAILIFVGEDAYIDCKVENQENYTVLFKFINPDQNSQNTDVITAGNIRITSDARFSILHHSEHEVWVLKIKNSQLSDSGIYICETNSNPKQQVARLLSVIEPDSSDTNGKTDTVFSDINHNYTDCCVNEGVPDSCHTLCHMSELINNQIPQHTVHSCLQHLPSITKCLNGGRNNLGCCQKQNIPSNCLSVCVGNFTLSTVTDHFLCMSYAAPMLACIAEGIETLPPQPEDITIEAISTTELKIKWYKPKESQNGKTDSYQINVTQLHTFDDLEDDKKINNLKAKDNSRPPLYGLQLSFTINATLSEYVIKDLKPFTMYEIRMTAKNKFGNSLPTNAMRTLTLSPESDSQKIPPNSSKNGPKLPNIRKCCEENGVMLDRCLNTLCDPTKADTASLSDLMICAPWANVTFKCMSLKTDENGWTDHSNCCKQRGVSSVCLSLCQGSVKRIDFRHFVCLDHMSAYTSCILDHHQVLPSEPQEFRVSNVHHDWAVVKWKPPKKLANTVLKYYIHWREAAADSPNVYQIEVSSRSPYLIDNLKPGFRYETFVSAVNKYGVSQGSVRVIFSTPQYSTPEEKELEESNIGYNETACCLRASLPHKCLPLCSYKIKVADVFNLSSSCVNSLSTLVRCGAGGRNHVPCCRRRDVSNVCLNVCAGLVDSSPYVVGTRCSQDFGKIIQCMEEGTGLLPGMPLGLHTNFITKDSVHIQWKPAFEDKEAAHITYQVRYGKTDEHIPLHPLEHTFSINATETKAVIKGLESNTHYSIYVTAHNLYGVSLPSLVLLVKTLDSNQMNQSNIIHSKLGPPHSLELIHQTVDSVTFKWLPPLYVPSDTSISYIVYYKAINGTAAIASNPTKGNWFSLLTPYTTMYLTNLTYNTEYALAIQAITDKNETSSSSEVILAWTDPAIPAAVQMPLIIPAGSIIEGSNITVMCVAMGTPVPVISMFINGQLVAKQESRHLTFSIANVNRNLTAISCYAINGFGKEAQSAQSSLDVYVKFKPSAKALPQITSAPIGGTARLICEVSANPQPRMLWFKQNNADIVQLSEGTNINLITIPHAETPLVWIYTLLIKRTSKSDTGNYMCTAENEFGKSVTSLTLEITSNDFKPRNTSSCCEEQGVSEECKSVCSLDIDIEAALSRPECFGELDKLMNCAADGSDHRQCCRRRQVPSACLRWCAGLKVNIPSLCILSSARDIISCFQEGKALLPGPPINVHIQQFIDENTVIVEWNPPEKNSELVQWYRVFWRPVGSRDLMRNQTENSWFELQSLESDKMYEFVVKSGNHYGLSIFTDPLVITIRGSKSHSTSLGNKLLKVILGISFGVLFILIGIAAVIYYYKFHYIVKNSQPRGVSFENPTYLKDSGTIQIHDSRVSAYVSDSVQSNTDKNENQE